MASFSGGFTKVIQAPFLFIIRLYQRTLSFDHGPLARFYPAGYCRFSPSCSEYTYQAIEQHGVIRGIALGAGRIMRCTPWNPGGNDPVPERGNR